MEAPFVDHNHGKNFFFYRIAYPIKIVNYSGRGNGMTGEDLQFHHCAPCFPKLIAWKRRDGQWKRFARRQVGLAGKYEGGCNPPSGREILLFG